MTPQEFYNAFRAGKSGRLLRAVGYRRRYAYPLQQAAEYVAALPADTPPAARPSVAVLRRLIRGLRQFATYAARSQTSGEEKHALYQLADDLLTRGLGSELENGSTRPHRRRRRGGWFPRDATLLYEKAKLSLAQGDAREAIQLCLEIAYSPAATTRRRGRRDRPHLAALVYNSSATTRQRGLARLLEAEALFRRHRFQSAGRVCTMAAKLLGEADPGVRRMRAWLDYAAGNYQAAQQGFEQALAYAPGDEAAIEGWFASALLGFEQDNVKESDWPARLEPLLARFRQRLRREQLGRALVACGDLLYDQSHSSASLATYRQAWREQPNNAYACESALSFLIALHRYKDARAHFEQARATFPQDLEIRSDEGYLYYKQQHFRKAYAVYRSPQLKAHPTSIEWGVAALRKMNDVGQAERDVLAALAADPKNVRFMDERAAVLFKCRRYEEAIEAFNKVLREHDADDQYAHQWKVASYRKLQRFAEARRAITAALRRAPRSAELWGERGWLYFDQDQLAEAEKCFARAMRLSPYLLDLAFYRVEILLRLGRPDEARAIFDELAQRFPEHLGVPEQRGWFYIRQGDSRRAKTEFETILARAPDSALGLNGMGGVCLEERDNAEAEEYFIKAIWRKRYEPQYHINRAWALVRQAPEPGARLRRRERLLNRAERSCRRALTFDPANAQAHGCLGVIAFKRRRYLDAESHFQKSIEVNPKEGSYVDLGSLYCQTGRLTEAKKWLLEALKLNRYDPRVHLELANLYLQSDQKSDAVREAQQAVAIDRNNDQAHKALAITLIRNGEYNQAEEVLRAALRDLQKEETRLWQLHLLLSQVLIKLGDDNKKPDSKAASLFRNKPANPYYNEALKHVNDALRIKSRHADIYFHAGIVRYKLEQYRAAQRNFVDCFELDCERFEAERYGYQLDEYIRSERRLRVLNRAGAYALSITCVVLVLVLWIIFLTGKGEKLKIEWSGLSTLTPVLLSIAVIAFLLPTLNELKLPGGFEAKIQEPEQKDAISAGPIGDISFGSALQTISPGDSGK